VHIFLLIARFAALFGGIVGAFILLGIRFTGMDGWPRAALSFMCGLAAFSIVCSITQTDAERKEAVTQQEQAQKQPEKEPVAEEKEPEPVKVKSPGELRQEQIKAGFSSWDGSHRQLEELIKKNMNDPDSYKHDATEYTDKGGYLIVSTRFRGKNAFGAMMLNTVKAKCGLDGNVIQIFSQESPQLQEIE
jgi:hypothetical protein